MGEKKRNHYSSVDVVAFFWFRDEFSDRVLNTDSNFTFNFLSTLLVSMERRGILTGFVFVIRNFLTRTSLIPITAKSIFCGSIKSTIGVYIPVAGLRFDRYFQKMGVWNS